MTETTPQRLRRISPEDIQSVVRSVLESSAIESASRIIEQVRAQGEAAVRRYAERFGERAADEPLVIGRDAMRNALDDLAPDDRAVLERTGKRIERFARAQRDSISDVSIEIPGGFAGHTIEPIESAGCYAPAGRYPLPSSVLMTAIAARVAGCQRVVVASPGAHPLMLASAAIAEADEFIAIGGAHAIAALAYGIESCARCDVIVGPGNKWVTAAKHVVSSVVGIDMLAGPSELLVLADDSADPALIAANRNR